MTDPIIVVGIAVLSATGGAFGKKIIDKIFPQKKTDCPITNPACTKRHKAVDTKLITLDFRTRSHEKRLEEGKNDFREIKGHISKINSNIEVLLDRTNPGMK